MAKTAPNPGPSGMPPAPTNGSNPITPHTTAPNPHPSHGLQRFPYPYFVIRSFIYPLFHPPSIPDLSSSSSFSTFSSGPPIIPTLSPPLRGRSKSSILGAVRIIPQSTAPESTSPRSRSSYYHIFIAFNLVVFIF